MTEAEKILKMIEDVDPADSDTLDEIDARVCAYIYGKEAYAIEKFSMLDKSSIGWSVVYPDREYGLGKCPDEYTRSRDALKAIRPEGWSIDCGQDILQTKSIAYRLTKEITQVASPMLPTEELAELHTIVQAIQWEEENQS